MTALVRLQSVWTLDGGITSKCLPVLVPSDVSVICYQWIGRSYISLVGQ